MKVERLVMPFVLAAALLAWAIPGQAGALPSEDDLELARRYAPVLYFHPAEVFFPQPVDVIVQQARLRQRIANYRATPRARPTICSYHSKIHPSTLHLSTIECAGNLS